MTYIDNERTAIGVMPTDERTQMVSQPNGEATQYAANVDCPVCHTPNSPSEVYCMDCGFVLSAQPVAVEQAPQEAPVGAFVTSDGVREFALKAGENTVGRQDSDILLTHNTVSRSHAKVFVEEGKVFVEDIGSSNGTMVDGQKLTPNERVEIRDNAEVVFGSMGLSFKAAEAAAEAEQTVMVSDAGDETHEGVAEPAESVSDAQPEEAAEVCTPEAEAEPELALEAETDQAPAFVGRLVSKDEAYSFDLKADVNTIGRRAGDNDIVIADPYCSGRHAELRAEGGTFTLTDIGSTNGTMVNGVKLEPNAPREVQESDEITLGQIVFRIEVA